MKKETINEKKENLKNYIFEACKDRAADYGKDSPKNWKEAKKMIFDIFHEEKGDEVARFGRREAFRRWVFGLCFISPIMEDLTPYTYKTDSIEQEEDTENKIYKLLYLYD